MVFVPTPTIVLPHGQPGSSATLWPLRRELLPRLPDGVRVLAPDRPGYGADPLPAGLAAAQPGFGPSATRPAGPARKRRA